MFEKIKQLIKEKGYTQAEIAKKMKISAKALNQKLNGVREFKLSELKALSRILKVPINKLEG